MANNNVLVINYHDACIYTNDLSLLQSRTAWLNDACINYQMTRLQQESCSGTTSTANSPEINIQLIDPSVVSYLMHSLDDQDEDDTSEFKGICRNLDLESQLEGGISILLVPINDNNGDGHMRCGGGNHWSLLVVVVLDRECVFYHFDSSAGFNSGASTIVAAKIRRTIEIGFGALTTFRKVSQCKTPQQNNGYDCGIHTIMAAEAILSGIHSDYMMIKKMMLLVDEENGNLQSCFEGMIGESIDKHNRASEMAWSKRCEIVDHIRSVVARTHC